MRLSLHQFAMKRKKKSMVPCPVTSILAAADYGGAGEPHAMVRLLGVAGFEGDSGVFGEAAYHRTKQQKSILERKMRTFLEGKNL